MDVNYYNYFAYPGRVANSRMRTHNQQPDGSKRFELQTTMETAGWLAHLKWWLVASIFALITETFHQPAT